MSHLGRPKGEPAADKNLKMDKVAARFGELLGGPVKKTSDEVIGPEARAAALALKPGEVLLLENLRFDAREQKNDKDFAHAIAALGDVYVNDAFGTCHNDNDASMVAVPAAMKGKPRVLGILVAKELEVIDGLMSSPKRPFLAIMGGAKVSDKIKFINALLAKVDHLLIGGKMTYAFLKARGVDVGSTKVADEEVAAARPLLDRVDRKITLPVDYVCAKSDDLNATQRVRRGDSRRVRRCGHRAEDAGSLREQDSHFGHRDLEWPGRLVREAGVRQRHQGDRRGDGSERRHHDRRRRRDGRGGRGIRIRRQDDPRLDRRRSLPRVRRGEEVRVAGAD